MSENAVRSVMGRAVSDTQFRKEFSSDTESALVGYDLTRSEVEALKELSHARSLWWGQSAVAPRRRRLYKAAWTAAYRRCLRDAQRSPRL